MNPFGGSIDQQKKLLIGGDKPVVKIFWGDEKIDENSTDVDPADGTKWDYVFEINGSQPVGLGRFQLKLMDWFRILNIFIVHTLKISVESSGHQIPSRLLLLILPSPNIQWMVWCFGWMAKISMVMENLTNFLMLHLCQCGLISPCPRNMHFKWSLSTSTNIHENFF